MSHKEQKQAQKEQRQYRKSSIVQEPQPAQKNHEALIVKILFFIMQILLILFAICWITGGIFLLAKKDYNIPKELAIGMIGVGVFILLAGVFGLASLRHTSRKMGILYMLMILVLLVIELIAMIRQAQVFNNLSSDFANSWDGLSDDAKTDLQNRLICCGLGQLQAGAEYTPACPDGATMGCDQKFTADLNDSKSAYMITMGVLIGIDALLVLMAMIVRLTHHQEK